MQNHTNRFIKLSNRYNIFNTTYKIYLSAHIHNDIKSSNESITCYQLLKDIPLSHTITWYSCGPTVYDTAHLGHARTYICTDIIRRIIMNYFNRKLYFAMGITDIDDKIINKGKSNNFQHWNEYQQMIRKLESDFFNDLTELNVLKPYVTLRVTEHIYEITTYIEQLITLGHAYITNDGVYFDVSSMKNEYDKFNCVPPTTNNNNNNNVDNIDNTLVDAIDNSDIKLNHNKKHIRDFALWKIKRTDNNGMM